MTKFEKDAKGRYYINGERTSQAKFLMLMHEEERKTYTKISIHGNRYSTDLPNYEKFQQMLLIKEEQVKTFKEEEKVHTWKVELKDKTKLYCAEKDISLIMYEDTKIVSNNHTRMKNIIRDLIQFVKEEFELEFCYFRIIVNTKFQAQIDYDFSEFEHKFSSKGYYNEQKINEAFKELWDKIKLTQSIIRIIFSYVNIVCFVLG